MMKKCLSFFSVLFFVQMSCVSVFAEGAMDTTAKQAIILDFDTGVVLFEKNADARMPTSSMSKVMTMYVVFEAIKNGKLSLEDELLVSEKAWKKGGSKMWVEVNKTAKVEDLVRGVIVQSGNDATIVLAEGLAGSEDAFAAALNRQAKTLGMDSSHFMNASGWPDPDHYSTARDLAKLTVATIRDHPDSYKYYAEPDFTYSNITQPNRNPLLSKGIGADGLKTGHTEDGGYGLIGTGMKDGRRVIMVLNGMESDKERAQESTRLLQWGLNGFSNVALFENEKILDRVPVYLGQKSSVSVSADHSVLATVPKLYETDMKIELEFRSPIKAPVTKGQEIGVVKVHLPKGGEVRVPLVAAENVAAMGGVMAFMTKARLLSSGEGYFGQ
ncbi:MAG: D-alanyl-D-alanine carboxypeptidase family protein [Alphaproteobacteria bacterium]